MDTEGTVHELAAIISGDIVGYSRLIGSDEAIWSERYDRDFTDIFEVQTEINEKILSALQITIEEAEFARVRTRPIENLNAYEAWHKGRTLIRQLTHEQLLEGRSLLERAIELQPDYGEAYAELANSYLAEFASWNMDLGFSAKTQELSRRALELSPHSAVTHTSAAVASMLRFRPDLAIVSATRAIELAPSGFDGYAALGAAQLQMGLIEEGTRTLERAVRLNPMTVDITYTSLASAYYRVGRVDEAVGIWERVRAQNPEALIDRLILVDHYQGIGETKLAETIVQEILHASPTFTQVMAVEMLQWAIGMPEELRLKFARNLELAGLPQPSESKLSEADQGERP